MKKALFFGDSNTYGYDPAGFMGGRYPKNMRWTTILQDKLADTWEISADGMPGRALPSTVYEWEYLRSLLRKEGPVDLFAVMLGTNDLLSTLRPDAAATARKMNDFLAFIEENTPETTDQLLIAPPALRLTDQSYMESYVAGDRSYAQIYFEEGERLSGYYRELAEFRQIRFADASKWTLDFAYDGVHLSERGHALFAEELSAVLR